MSLYKCILVISCLYPVALVTDVNNNVKTSINYFKYVFIINNNNDYDVSH